MSVETIFDEALAFLGQEESAKKLSDFKLAKLIRKLATEIKRAKKDRRLTKNRGNRIRDYKWSREVCICVLTEKILHQRRI